MSLLISLFYTVSSATIPGVLLYNRELKKLSGHFLVEDSHQLIAALSGYRGPSQPVPPSPVPSSTALFPPFTAEDSQTTMCFSPLPGYSPWAMTLGLFCWSSCLEVYCYILAWLTPHHVSRPTCEDSRSEATNHSGLPPHSSKSQSLHSARFLSL